MEGFGGHKKNLLISYHSNLRSIPIDLLQRYPERVVRFEESSEARNNDRDQRCRTSNITGKDALTLEKTVAGHGMYAFPLRALPGNAMFITVEQYDPEAF